MPTDTKIAIVICLYNQLQYSKITIASILKHTKLPYTVFLVNNNSQDGTREFCDEMVRQYPDKFVVIHSETNLGFAGGNNLALRLIQKDSSFTHILLLNNDTILSQRYIENMMKVFSVDKNIGCVVPVTNFAGNRQCIPKVQIDPKTFEEFAAKWEFAKGNHHRSWQIGMAIGFCMLIKRECFDKVGLLDEIFMNAWEDNDLCLRMAKEGFSIYVAQDCFVYHFGSKTIQSLPKEVKYVNTFEENKKRFYDKWSKINKIGEHKKIVGMLRVKNGGEILKRVVESVARMVDEIVVFDDHSTDETEQICKSCSKVVNYYKSEHTEFNEARDRNKVLQMAKDRTPDWIFSFDADEESSEELINNIQKIVNNPNPEIKLYCFQICHLWNTGDIKNNTHHRSDGLWNFFSQGRLFKNEPNQEIKVNEEGLHSGSTPYFSQENMMVTHYRIRHYGNADPSQRLKKYMWYTRTDKNKDRNAILGGWYEWYRKLYQQIEKDKPENQGKELGEYVMKDSDMYRHIVNENTLVLTEWKENIKLSAAIIVKEGDFNELPKCLESIKDIVDEIVLVRTDGGEVYGRPLFSQDIEEKIKDYYHKWQDSFSEARNFALSKCTGDWVLRIDADEILKEEAKLPLMKIIKNDEAEVILFPIINYQQPEDGKQTYTMSKTARVYKNLKGLMYVGRVHEEISDSITELGKTQAIRINDVFPVPLIHNGYLRDKDALFAKYDYYNSLLMMDVKDNPKRPEPYFNLGVDFFHQDDLDKAEMYYRKSLEIKPDQWKVHSDLSVVAYKKALKSVKNQLEEALEHCRKAKELIDKSSDQSGINHINVNEINLSNLLNQIKPKERDRRVRN